MMRRALTGLVTLAAIAALPACSEQETVAELRSLAASEDAVFICRDADGNGHPFSDCPDYDAADDADPTKNLSVYSLVSQTVTNEIAVVDITAGHVVDVDEATPGYGFLRVGGRPSSMAVTPGGLATFVTTSDVGRHGVFALATSCIAAPKAGEPSRDLTSWPACRLPSAPGEIAVLVDPEEGAATCTSSSPLTPRTREEAGQCSANLSEEATGGGARKLVVSLPDEGKLVVLDAQTLLNEKPGEFRDCIIESTVSLAAEVPAGVEQRLPADLQLSETCQENATPRPPAPTPRSPQPAGFAVSDGRLYVADQAAPVIHVLDVTSACGITELPSLLPMSLREPDRVVTTRKVAVSPLTPQGRRYLYAIDAEDQPGASVMAFDVSPDSTDPTPIVRPGSPEQPNEKPDRLSIGSSARDVTFAYRDIPYVNESTGVAQFGTTCDPNPATDAESPGGLARPSDDYTDGARPGLLRGLFGFVLQTDGRIAVVDVDDFDAACRRPVQTNPSSTPDFRGCVNDSEEVMSYADQDGKRLVTGEVSCRVVEPHRFRRATLAINDSDVGVRAPSLRGFPQLTLPNTSAEVPVLSRPRLLAVSFPGTEDVDVFVGSTRYSTKQGGDDALAVEPNSTRSEQLQSLNSVVLPPLEPRAYPAEDRVAVTYEGTYAGERSSGFLTNDGEGFALDDTSLSFCNAGVYDLATMTDYAQNELGLNADDAASFAEAHADYVQITSTFPREDDSYWRAPNLGATYEECERLFGKADAEELVTARDFSVVTANGNRLTLVPRPSTDAADVKKIAAACFPSANKYRLRGGKQWIVTHAASGFRHDVIESGTDRRCVRSCSPLRKWAKGRVFEIASSTCVTEEDAVTDPSQNRVGCAKPDEVACVFDQERSASVDVKNPCVFNGITERFAVYRGRTPSARDAVFSWQTTGGYSPLTMSLAAISSTVSPQSIQFLQHPEVLAVVDGSSQGLSLFSLDTFAVAKPSPFY